MPIPGQHFRWSRSQLDGAHHGQESEEGSKEGKESRQEEKEVGLRLHRPYWTTSGHMRGLAIARVMMWPSDVVQ